MTATEDDQPLGEFPEIAAIERGGVIGLLSAADQITATVALAKRQAAALAEIQALAEYWSGGLPGQPFARRAGRRLLAVLDADGLLDGARGGT